MKACTEGEEFTQRPSRVLLYSRVQKRGKGVNDSTVMIGH